MNYPVPPNQSQLAMGAAMAMNLRKLKGTGRIPQVERIKIDKDVLEILTRCKVQNVYIWCIKG